MNDVDIEPGTPYPYGISALQDGFNFALFSRHAYAVHLCLFDLNFFCKEFPLDPSFYKTGDVWHIKIRNSEKKYSYYAFRIEGPQKEPFTYDSSLYLLDPYAKIISTRNPWGSNSDLLDSRKSHYTPLGVIPNPSDLSLFDWQNVSKPQLPLQDLIIYEMHVRGFTIDSSSQVKHPGTFLGVIEKIPFLLELGINAIELMPIQEFDENEVQLYSNPALRNLHNYWGYSTVNFFAPMNRYAFSSEKNASLVEFKTMVRELHRNGIEVILDVVFNHTAEGDAKGPILSFKGIDAPIYYIHNAFHNLSNYSGCGNTFNCNHPVVRQFIVDCLIYWHMEMGVDGFRFDLASILMRGISGEPLDQAPLIEEITEHPLLASVKMIAEPWDAVGLYHVGRFVPQNKRWAEWNGKYRDTLRKFIKGGTENDLKGEFVTRLCGSQDLYHNRSPLSSINFITSHDGFSLHDLVSYNEKHNEANGENNQDGDSQNYSWNCGVEGPTDDEKVLQLRERQMRNFHLAMMVSQGIPMLLMGNEYAHTKRGNNNTWCQDNDLSWFLWNKLAENSGFYRFYQRLIHFRKANPLLKRTTFLTSDDVEWHGLEPLKPTWHQHFGVAAFTLLDKEKDEDLYIIFNAEGYDHPVTLPPPKQGMQWHWIVNTHNPSPYDFFDTSPPVTYLEQTIPSFTAWMLKQAFT
jgi:isoamylase